ncbi:trypco2 family protein [Streptomyces coeruleorubidus]|uniref:trypco2 family protein n=1 Tax=Streptomyces coeruleorubidus TaxID=116188 RepID=UPI0033CE01B9
MIGLKEAIQATYDELTAAADGGAHNPLRFQYSSIELEMTIAMSDSRERQGGLKVWVLDGFRKRIRGKTSTHTVRVTIEPHTSAGGEVAYTVHK